MYNILKETKDESLLRKGLTNFILPPISKFTFIEAKFKISYIRLHNQILKVFLCKYIFTIN